MSQDNFTLSKAGPSFGRYLKPALVLTESSPALSPEDRELLTRRFEEAVAKNRQAYEALKESRSQSASSQLLSPPPPPAAPHSAAAAAAPIPFSVNTSSCVYEDSVEIPISTPISTSQSKSFDNSYGEPSLPSLNGTSTVTISGTPSSSMNLSISLNDDSDSNLNSSAGEKMVAVKPIGERWEKAVKDMVVTGLLGDRYRKEKDNAMKSVLDICKEFNEAAVTYMRTIVSERFKPVSNRTITIIELGGAAGGNKFIVGNEYFFKFPEKDIKIKYPSYDAAAKVAGHELKANTHLFAVITNSNIYKKIKGLVPKNLTKDTDTTELRKKIIVPPLMVLIDYLGFRAVAMTKFDLGEFIAGSSNGGANMVNKLDDNTHEILGLVKKIHSKKKKEAQLIIVD